LSFSSRGPRTSLNRPRARQADRERAPADASGRADRCRVDGRRTSSERYPNSATGASSSSRAEPTSPGSRTAPTTRIQKPSAPARRRSRAPRSTSGPGSWRAQFLQHNYVTLADVAEPSCSPLSRRAGASRQLSVTWRHLRLEIEHAIRSSPRWLGHAVVTRDYRATGERASPPSAQVWESPPRHPALQGLPPRSPLAQDIRSTLHPTATPSSSEGTLLLRDLKAVWSPRSRPSHR
jgi:hypothetical protein